LASKKLKLINSVTSLKLDCIDILIKKGDGAGAKIPKTTRKEVVI